MKAKILVPLGGVSAWNDNELKYMLRSLEQNMQFDFEVYLYADHVPQWLYPKYVNIEIVQRYYPQWLLKENNGNRFYENFFDTLNKLDSFCSNNIDGSFVYTYDDVILLEKIYSVHYIQNVANEVDSEKKYNYRKSSKDRHLHTINQAVDILNESAQDNDNRQIYETHLPRVFNAGDLKMMFKNFDFRSLRVPYAPATMYFNLYKSQASDLPPLIEHNDLKAGFYNDELYGDSGTLSSIEHEVRGKMWMSYNDKGLNGRSYEDINRQLLKEWIQNKFPNKSRYEK